MDECADRIGKRLLNSCNRDSPITVWLGHGQRHNARLFRSIGSKWFKRHVCRLETISVAVHYGCEGRIDGTLNVRQRTKTVAQRDPPGAGGLQDFIDAAVEADIGSSKTIDGLLRVTYQKKFPRYRANFPPVRQQWIGGRKQQQDFRLQRIGVLELVDKNASEAILKARPHNRIVAQKISRLKQ